MSKINIRISAHAKATLRELARHEGKPMQAVLDEAIERYQRERFLDEANAAYARLKSDPEAWEEELAEREQSEHCFRQIGYTPQQMNERKTAMDTVNLGRYPIGIVMLMIAVCAPSIQADTTYTYTGNDFATAIFPYSTGDRITGYFTVPTTLVAGLSQTEINPTSYSFMDGLNTLNNTNSFIIDFLLSTDPTTDAFTGWSIFLTSGIGLSSPFPSLDTEVFPSVQSDDVRDTSTVQAFVDDNPGTWTETLNGFQGGTTAATVSLPNGPPVSAVTGTIGGLGTEDYYSFYWAGGAFLATGSITGTPNAGASYLFSEGVAGTCSSGGTETLNSGDSYTSTIAIASLAPGTYCIGIDANNSNDPAFSLTFNTPVQGAATPEPSTFVLLSAGLGMLTVFRLRNRSPKAS